MTTNTTMKKSTTGQFFVTKNNCCYYSKVRQLGPGEFGNEDAFMFAGEDGFLEESYCNPLSCKEQQSQDEDDQDDGEDDDEEEEGEELELPPEQPQKLPSCVRPPFHPPSWKLFAAQGNPAELFQRYLKAKKVRYAQTGGTHVRENDFLDELLDARLELDPTFNSPESRIPASERYKHWPPHLPLPILPPGLKLLDLFAPSSRVRTLAPAILQIPNSPPTLPDNLKDTLCSPEGTSCIASPASLVFYDPEVGQTYPVTIKIQNRSGVPRKLSLLPPAKKCFDLSWAAELNEGTMVPSGLTIRVILEFKPTSDEQIQDFLTVIIEGDGNLIIPISAFPPILEIEEWDCGTSIVGEIKTCSFEIKNFGGEARFWLLTEDEFQKEYLAFRGESEEEGEDDNEAEEADIHNERRESEASQEYEETMINFDEEVGEYDEESIMKVRTEYKEEYGEGDEADLADEEIRLEEETGKSDEENKIIEENFDEKTGDIFENEEKSENNEETEKLHTTKKSSAARESSEGKELIPLNGLNRPVGDDTFVPDPCLALQKGSILNTYKMDHFCKQPFEVFPCCFHLQKLQKITTTVSFKPKEIGFYCEKIGILCDNGEIRWVLIKGVGTPITAEEEGEDRLNSTETCNGPTCTNAPSKKSTISSQGQCVPTSRVKKFGFESLKTLKKIRDQKKNTKKAIRSPC